MSDLNSRLEAIKKKLNLVQLKEKMAVLQKESENPSFWQNHEQASEKMKQLSFWQKEISQVEDLEALIKAGKDQEAGSELDKLELKTFLSGQHDQAAAILSIHSGQGGVEAMDWTAMLKRMYLKYFDSQKWPYEVVEETAGEEAGLKSTTFKVNAPIAYGFLKHEAGTHRLVRQSPFNADALRQTSFALVEVLPQIEEKGEMEIKDDDLEWQFFRSSSQGGQNVQKVSTAVRLIHKPSGLVVTCQTQRYQEQNRKIALELLRSKLWQQQEKKRLEEKKVLKQGRTQAGWGSQIRSYVLHPYKLVKDLRTDQETSNAEAVLDGKLEEFIEAETRQLN